MSKKIKECNFRWYTSDGSGSRCELMNDNNCHGEDKCILFQVYRMLRLYTYRT